MLPTRRLRVLFFQICGLLLCASVTGCVESRTGFDLSVVVDDALTVDKFIYIAKLGEESSNSILTTKREGVLLVVPDSWAGQKAQIEVQGIVGGKVVAQGSAAEEVRLEMLRAVVIFVQDEGCDPSCKEGQATCVNDAVRQCAAGPDGCVRWSPAVPCPADRPYCSNGACAVGCKDECEAQARRCDDNGRLQICGLYDSDDCREWGTPLRCAAAEVCLKGQCVAQCNEGPCACSPNETKPCADVGQCKGGLRRCEDGQLGSCQWEQGPSPERCDGIDNDCNGATDDGLFAPACELRAGVCAGARQRCKGREGWQGCSGADYQAMATRLGAVFETEETRCDGFDNDCDGKTDEADSCHPNPCGNGTCDDGETNASCPKDCPPDPCGNGKCDSGETNASCPKDCPPNPCGNGKCDSGETNASCPKDCPPNPCGNGKCDSGETNANCPKDCSKNCGDGFCELGETSHNCARDCRANACGDGSCHFGETAKSCPADCALGGGHCGDGRCTHYETTKSCARDCPEGDCKVARDRRCVVGDALMACDNNNRWVLTACEQACQREQGGKAEGCIYWVKEDKDICRCTDETPFFAPCTRHGQCGAFGVCAKEANSKSGYCTLPCDPVAKVCTVDTGSLLPFIGDCLTYDVGFSGCAITCPLVGITNCPNVLRCEQARCVPK